MKEQRVEQGSIEKFLIRYKKWFIAAIGIHMIPGLIFLSAIIGMMVWQYVGSDIRWHPYKLYITSGYNSGLEEGSKDRNVPKPKNPGWGPWPEEDSRTYSYLDATLWSQYTKETDLLRAKALEEKDDYFNQLPENTRGTKRSEMNAEGFKFPLEIEVEKRFTSALDFYTDYVAKKIKREDYANDKEHLEAMQTEAWKVGYEFGYARGRASDYQPGSI